MATIKLAIVGDTRDVYKKIGDLESYAKSMKPIQLKFSAVGLNEVSKNALALAKAQAQIEISANKAAAAEARARTASLAYGKQAEATRTQEARRAAETQKTATALVNLATQQERTRTSAQNYATQTEKTKAALAGLRGEQEKTATSTISFGNVFDKAWSRITSTIGRRLINQAFTALRSNIQETLNVMKAVDTQLINIQKVSGKSSEEIAAIGERAYDTAAKYGVAVEDYLSAVYSFQKAGLGENAEELAELATKTMLVGDTTSAVAEKFLVSSNAAWELHGNIAELNKVIDEADYINNNYATTLDKIAAGLPIVASVAANAGMSYSETMAALGTIQSITQESGTKSATALRALILNIEKEVGTYVTDEGEEFEVTAESVKGLQGLLEKYAKTEMDAARASGELLNPMVAIKALFEGMRNEDLSETELFQLLSAMGGKLRTNQLTALVKNFDMFDQMLQQLGDSAGTADKEIGLMMQSWEKKTQVLKDRWQQFIAGLVSTDEIKGLVDDITEFVTNLDPEKIGTAIRDAINPIINFIRNTDWAGAAKHLSEIFDKITKVASGGVIAAGIFLVIGALEKVIGLITTIGGLIGAAGLLKDAGAFFSLLSTEGPAALALLGPTGGLVLGLGAVLAGVVALGAALDEQGKKVKAYEEWDNTLKDLNSQYDKLTGKGSELDTLREKGRDLTDVEKKRLGILEEQAAALDEQIQKTKDLKYEAWQNAYGNGAAAPVFEYDENGTRTGSHKGTKDEYDWAEIQHEVQLAREAYGSASISADEYRSKLLGVIDAYKDTYTALVEMKEAGKTSSSQENLIDYYERLAEAANASGEEIRFIQEWPQKVPIEDSPLAEFWRVDVEAETAKYKEYLGAIAEAAQNAQNELDTFMGNVGSNFNEWGVSQSVIDEMAGAFSSLADTANTETAPAVENVSDQLEEIPENKDITLTPHFTNALAAIGQYVHFLSFLKENYSSTLTSTITHDDKAGGKFSQIKAGPGGISTTYGNAEGTDNWRGGPTLVNELGPELISENGRAFIAGGGKPTVVNLAPGAIVIPADETREALKGGKKPKYARALPFGAGAKLATNGNWANIEAGYMLSVDKTSSKTLALIQNGNGGGGGGKGRGGSSSSSASNTITFNFPDLERQLSDALKLLEAQVELAENEGDYPRMAELYEKAQESIKDLVDKYRQAGYSDDSIEVLTLLNKNYDYANKQLKLYQDKWDDLIDALSADTDATKAAKELEEKRLALEEATAAYENAQKQRTVRMYNASTGQWEWIADDKKIQSARDTVSSAEEAYADTVKKQAIAELERMKETVTDLSDVVLGPALSAVATMAESSDEFQNFARALNAVFGVGSFLQSTEGTTKAISTVDSHDTTYSFGGVDISPEQASTMSLKDLAQMLQVLKIT